MKSDEQIKEERKREDIDGDRHRGKLFTSLPTGIPLPRPAVRPMTLAMKALKVRYSFRTTPLRMVFSSGIPEPEKNRQGMVRKT